MTPTPKRASDTELANLLREMAKLVDTHAPLDLLPVGGYGMKVAKLLATPALSAGPTWEERVNPLLFAFGEFHRANLGNPYPEFTAEFWTALRAAFPELAPPEGR